MLGAYIGTILARWHRFFSFRTSQRRFIEELPPLTLLSKISETLSPGVEGMSTKKAGVPLGTTVSGGSPSGLPLTVTNEGLGPVVLMWWESTPYIIQIDTSNSPNKKDSVLCNYIVQIREFFMVWSWKKWDGNSNTIETRQRYFLHNSLKGLDLLISQYVKVYQISVINWFSTNMFN